MHGYFKFIHFRCLKWPLAARMASPLTLSLHPYYLSCQPMAMASTPAAAEISSKQLREMFMEFFIARGHQRVPSAPVLDKHRRYNRCDFICAGVQQFTPVLIGERPAPASRVVNSQKCIRLDDNELVGHDGLHHTFFEMLGNWSFGGDYFKKEICSWAWEFLTKWLNISPDRLYVSYFGGDTAARLDPDEECRQIWLSLGVPNARVLPFGMKDNFWELGDSGGPCGPCSEIHYDRIGNRDASSLVNADDPMVVEIWNLVFIQFNREESGQLKPLPNKHIDCGLGFERLVAVVQQKTSNYDTDLFTPIFNTIQEETGIRPYMGKMGTEDEGGIDMAYRLIGDHIRTLTVALAEDINILDKKKYARKIKKLFKRTSIIAHEHLGLPRGGLVQLVPLVIDLLADGHPDLREAQPVVMAKVEAEERRIWAQRDAGWQMMERMVQKMPQGTTTFPGKFAYDLVYKYRLEIELIQERLKQRGLTLDEGDFEKRVQQRLERYDQQKNKTNEVMMD